MSPTGGRPSRPRREIPPQLGIGLPLLVGLVHVALVAPHYFVGSFDDDASYVLTAKALLAGGGLTGHLASGEVAVGLYPPGYGALLAPLVWVWPHSFLPLQLLSVACYAAVFPLTWMYLGRRRVSPAVRTAVLAVLALGPPLATYGSMIMAETPFLVVLLLLLLALDRWQDQTRVLTRWAAAVLVLAASLIWLKQAGLGLVVGLVLWLPFSRATRAGRRALLVTVGVGATLVPVVVARLIAGIPLAGARYSAELGGYYAGGLLKRLTDVLPSSTHHLLSTALPATLVPYLEPLPLGGDWTRLWKDLSIIVTVFVVIGAAVWVKRHRDAAVPMTIVYLAECVLWPFVNERRTILVVPLLAVWLVTGAVGAWTFVRDRLPAGRTVLAAAGSTAVVVLAIVPLAAQLPRDYLYAWGQSGSHFAGSRYVAILSRLGPPSDVVETDYRSSVALFTGHATNWDAFLAEQGSICYEPGVLAELSSDQAAFLLVGDVNKPGIVDNACLASLASTSPWAVPLLHTSRDDATVYELVGPYTGRPGVANVLAGRPYPAVGTTRDTTVETWQLPVAAPVSQVSLGQAQAAGGTASVQVEVRRPDGGWSVVATTGAGVGDGPRQAPYLVYTPRRAQEVVAVRVIVTSSRPWSVATVNDLAVLGPSEGPTTSTG